MEKIKILCKICEEYIDDSVDSHFDNYHYEDFEQWLQLAAPDEDSKYSWLKTKRFNQFMMTNIEFHTFRNNGGVRS